MRGCFSLQGVFGVADLHNVLECYWRCATCLNAIGITFHHALSSESAECHLSKWKLSENLIGICYVMLFVSCGRHPRNCITSWVNQRRQYKKIVLFFAKFPFLFCFHLPQQCSWFTPLMICLTLRWRSLFADACVPLGQTMHETMMSHLVEALSSSFTPHFLWFDLWWVENDASKENKLCRLWNESFLLLSLLLLLLLHTL